MNLQPTDTHSGASQAGSRWRKRRWTMRILAVATGLFPVAALELAARILWSKPTAVATDPYVELDQQTPLFEFNPALKQYETSPARLRLFRPQAFSHPKPATGYRVFALGGSTTGGEPFSTQTAFPKWLELRLQAMLPSREVQVVNCGGLSYASYRVNRILTEVLEFQPDLVVIYTGQNEYLEQRNASQEAQQTWYAEISNRLARHSRFAQVVRESLHAPAQPAPSNHSKMSAEVEALLDYQGGLQRYRRGDAWYAPVPKQLRWNTTQMAAQCDAANVPVLFCLPVTNLLDCPPIKFEMDPALPRSRQQEFASLWEKATQANTSGQSPTARQALEAALEIDPQHAGAHFLLGRILHQQHEMNAAKLHLTAARDWDVCPLRATSAIREAIRSGLKSTSAQILDVDALFCGASPHGIVDRRWLVDHVHPSVAGHQMLAAAIGDCIVANNWIKIEHDDWRKQEQQLAQEHLQGLGEEYYHRGKQRLAGLLLWTQGRSKQLHPNLAPTKNPPPKTDHQR